MLTQQFELLKVCVFPANQIHLYKLKLVQPTSNSSPHPPTTIQNSKMRKFLEKNKYNLETIESIKRRGNELTEQHAKVAKNRHELGIYRCNEPSTYQRLRTLSTLKKEVPLNPVKKMLEYQTANLELKQ